MATRTQAREAIMQTLYAIDLGNEDFINQADEFLEEKKIKNKQREFALSLLKGTLENKDRIDDIINAYLVECNFSYLGYVERSILRLGIYEILYTSTDLAVIINEAVELAKSYGQEKSFVNGILDAIAKNTKEQIEEKIILNKKILESKKQELAAENLKDEAKASRDFNKDSKNKEFKNKEFTSRDSKSKDFKNREFRSDKGYDKNALKDGGFKKDFKQKDSKKPFRKDRDDFKKDFRKDGFKADSTKKQDFTNSKQEHSIKQEYLTQKENLAKKENLIKKEYLIKKSAKITKDFSNPKQGFKKDLKPSSSNKKA